MQDLTDINNDEILQNVAKYNTTHKNTNEIYKGKTKWKMTSKAKIEQNKEHYWAAVTCVVVSVVPLVFVSVCC